MWQLINLFPKCKREYINITVKENKIVDVIINYGFASVTISYTNINEIDDLDINKKQKMSVTFNRHFL